MEQLPFFDAVDYTLMNARAGFNAGFSRGLGYMDPYGYTYNPPPPQVYGHGYQPVLKPAYQVVIDQAEPVVDMQSRDILGLAVVLLGVFVLFQTMK